MNYQKLRSGDKIPILGLGTWQLTGDECIETVQKAIKLGYRHIDTAAAYGNHQEVSKGIQNSEIERENLFITSKIWRDSLYNSEVISGTKEILNELNLDYLD